VLFDLAALNDISITYYKLRRKQIRKSPLLNRRPTHRTLSLFLFAMSGCGAGPAELAL
jgi:hypothetical protein